MKRILCVFFAVLFLMSRNVDAQTAVELGASSDKGQAELRGDAGEYQEVEEADHTLVGLNTPVTAAMMEPNQNLKKVELLAESKSNIKRKALDFGFSMISIMNYQRSNTNSKFAYLMRHPTSANQVGKTASEAVVHSAQISLVGSLNDWMTSYGELLYNPQQSFGGGIITDLPRNQIDMRKAFLLFGNLEKMPLYFALGKMDIPFGQTGSVSPFTNSTMWHAFGGLAYAALLGYKKAGLSLSLTAIQGGAQFRAANVPVDSTNVPSRLNNWAVDAHYTIKPAENFSVRLGASYLKGSAYVQDFPIVHFEPGKTNNPAMAFYSKINLNALTIMGSFATTLDVWPGTFNPNPPLNEFQASRVASMNLGAGYQIATTDKLAYIVSGEFSNFITGPEGAPWERQNQYVFGLNVMIENSSRLFVEMIRTEGFVPLNFMTGGNFSDPGVTISDRDVQSQGVVIGMQLSL